MTCREDELSGDINNRGQKPRPFLRKSGMLDFAATSKMWAKFARAKDE
jgi:hypothetical protein